MNDWVDCQLGDLANFKNGKTSPNREDRSSIPVYGSNGIIGYSDQTNAKSGTSIIGRVGSYCGSVYYSRSACWITDNAIAGEPREGKADRKFLYYLLKRLNLNNVAHGSGQPLLNQSVLNCVQLIVPPTMDEQQAISDILSSLDEKIELNRRQNRTLEAIAQTLFKRWFVEFEFPDENGQPYKSSGGAMQPSELGEIPLGWEVVKIGDAVEILGGGTPSTTVAEYWDNGDVTWYSPTDLTKAGTLYSQGSRKKITQVGLQNSSAKLFPAYSLMMTSRATIGVVSMNRTPACTNQGFITLIPNEEFLLYQLHGWLLQHMPLIHSKSSGTTFKEISRGSFKGFDIVKTTVGLKYAELVEPIYRKVEANTLEGETLTAIRDTLLPKLMSGELRVA